MVLNYSKSKDYISVFTVCRSVSQGEQARIGSPKGTALFILLTCCLLANSQVVFKLSKRIVLFNNLQSISLEIVSRSKNGFQIIHVSSETIPFPLPCVQALPL